MAAESESAGVPVGVGCRLPTNKDCSEQASRDIRDYLEKHCDDDPEPIEVHVWYEEHYEYSISHVVYAGEEYSIQRPPELGLRAQRCRLRRHDPHDGVIDVQ